MDEHGHPAGVRLANAAQGAQPTLGIAVGGHADAARARLAARGPRPRGAAQRLLEQPHVFREDHAPLVAVVHAAADDQRLARP